MQKVYYTRMRSLPLFLTLAIAAIANAKFQQNQPTTALKTSSLESHEGLTISARPWTDAAQYREAFPKNSPFSAGVLAIQVIFRNDSDESVKITIDRIRMSFQISDENRQELQPLRANEVADAVLKPGAKDPSTRKRLPLPVGIPGGGNDKKWTELQAAAQNAAVPTGVVASHSNVKGLLYFDLRGQFDLLSTAHLYVPEVTVMKDNRALTFFEIDLSRPNGN